jgi:hypothetical protein
MVSGFRAQALEHHQTILQHLQNIKPRIMVVFGPRPG